MIYKVQRWSPDTCRCVIEQVVGYDEQGNCVEDPKFLLMNEVCDKHAHMKSTQFVHNHQALADNVTNLIEQTKARNMKQVDDQLGFAHAHVVKGKAKMIRDLQSNRVMVQRHNDEITEEWYELVSFPHAFDAHIADIVLTENRAKNAADAAAAAATAATGAAAA